MAKSWSLDKSMMEKHALVRAKAGALGIPESEAYRLCVLEYELDTPMTEYSQQAENAYHVYMTEAPRPGTSAADELKRKMAYELLENDAYAWQKAEKLKLAAEAPVRERMIAKVGVEEYEKGIRSLEAFEADPTSAGYKKPFLGGIKLPSFDVGIGEGLSGVKRSMQTIGIVVMLFIALLVYLVFVKGKGAEGVSVSAVGK